MATRGSVVSYADLAAALLSSSEVAPRARLIAEQVAQFLPGGAVVVYVLDQDGKWAPRATDGEVAFAEPVIDFDFGTLGIMGHRREPVLFTGSELKREAYAHLNIRRTLVSLAGIPLLAGGHLVGGIELLSFSEPIAPSLLASLADLVRLAALGMAAGMSYELERNTSLESISRITQLYDLEKVFNATLEMDKLLPIITSKFRELLDVQAVNLWLVQDEELALVSQSGQDPSRAPGSTLRAGGGVVWDVSESGEAVLIESAEDARLAQRNAGVDKGKIFSLVVAPILHEGALVGVAEAVNKMDGTPFDEDDLFLLQNVSEAAAGALHNASLLQAERKVEILETLVHVSREITSTLNLERVMQAIVNGPHAVIPYERAAIALEQGGRLKLRAVSGISEFNPGDPAFRPLSEMLEWASLSDQEIFVRQHGEEIDEPREETRAKFREYFTHSGARAFYALPLGDDQGRVGLLSFESTDPDFLGEAHLEMIKVLAGQATVALRNAQLYKEVPFIGVLEPVLEKKRKFLAMEKRRRKAILATAALVVFLLIVVPFPMRVEGDAIVAPARTAQVMPEVEGVVRAVYVREGQAVAKGTILADLDDWNYRAGLAAAEAKYNIAVSQMNHALASNDGTEAGIQKLQADYWRAEVARARERLEQTHLRSPIAGVVATAYVENLVGRHLEAGDKFAEVVDTSNAQVDVAVDQQDEPLLKTGTHAAIKLDAFPTRTFPGQVAVLSPVSQVQGDQRTFFARVTVGNPQGVIRGGMQGRGKISAGWYPSGYVLFRRPSLWMWSKLWDWFGW